ncbi:hypothetical protein GCK72_002687 [Caenorhabditis remanei]|uniref:F-box associated domain-containing protein n=1 Tax=Caenorhabditis remanei TaxID=31234 RepID=A0A6A5HWT8_CAERE|nr:hypothetical protein GCK72_002687 [Caenorhabditis remanei]KAF1770863.1 hypothetical protein GCK72_002687 [Caenorhabditis remanei]
MLSLCSKVSKSKCKLMKPAKPLRLKVDIGIGVKLTVKFENPRPETESVKKNSEWKALYVDDFDERYPFTIAHEFSYLTTECWLSNDYNSKTDRTTSKYWISKRYFNDEFLKWVDTVIEVFNASIDSISLEKSYNEKVIKWIESRRTSIDKLSVHCYEPLESLQNILKYSKPKKEFNIQCEVFNPGCCPIIHSKCTAFTDEDLIFFLKNWKRSDINVESLSVARTSSSSDIDEKAVIEELDTVKLQKALQCAS